MYLIFLFSLFISSNYPKLAWLLEQLTSSLPCFRLTDLRDVSHNFLGQRGSAGIKMLYLSKERLQSIIHSVPKHSFANSNEKTLGPKFSSPDQFIQKNWSRRVDQNFQ